MFKISAKLCFITGFFLLVDLQLFGIYCKEDMMMPPLFVNGTTSEILEWVEQVEMDHGEEAAIDMYTQISQYYETTFGPQHSSTITLLMRLCTVYLKTGKYEKALPLTWKIYRLLEQKYGKDHLHTLDALTELGKIYMHNGKYEKAEKFLKRAYQLSKTQLGQNDQSTIDTLFYLANVYRLAGNPEKMDLALRYYRKVYDVRSKDPKLGMGEEHEATLVTLVHIADVLKMKNEIFQATEILEKVIAIRTKTLGENHPSTQEVKKDLFRTLSNAGKIRQAKKVLESANQNTDEEDESFFTLVVGKANSLAEAGKHAQALEMMTELYEHEILKGPLLPASDKILRVLDKLIFYSHFQGDFDQTLKWANVLFGLIENKQQKSQKVKVEVTPNDQKNLEDMTLFHLNAIKSCIHVYSNDMRNDEKKVDEYFKKASKVMQGHAQVTLLIEKFLSITKTVADFKTQIGKSDQALNILNDFFDRFPQSCATSVCSMRWIIEIALKHHDYKMMQNIALKFFTNTNNQQQQEKKRVEKMQEIKQFLLEYLSSKAHELFDLENYEDAFSLYKTVEKIWPETWIDDSFSLERISNTALILQKFDEALFYMDKIKEVLKNRLLNEPNLDQKERAAVNRDFENTEKLGEKIKQVSKITSFAKQVQNFKEHNLPPNSNNDNVKKDKIEL